jgi:hypothetical protein
MNFYYGPVNRLAQGISARPLVEMRFSKLSGDVSPTELLRSIVPLSTCDRIWYSVLSQLRTHREYRQQA